MSEKKEDKKIYQKAVEKWGKELQVKLVIEEMAELIVAISHYYRGRGSILEISEEIADVEIMLEQLKYSVFNNNEEVERFKQQKFEHIKKMIEK